MRSEKVPRIRIANPGPGNGWKLIISSDILVLRIGLYPGPFMEMMDASVTNLIEQNIGTQVANQ